MKQRKARIYHNGPASGTEGVVPSVSEKASTETANNLSEVKVFPNPASGQFHVAFNIGKAADVMLKVTDLNGKEVYAETFNGYSGKFGKEIKSANLSTGTYIVNIQAGNETETTRVVMQ